MAGLGCFLAHPAEFTRERIADFFSQYGSWFLVIHCFMLILRVVALLPGTPFILAAAFLMPEHPMLVLAVTILGMTISSTLVYHISDWLGLREHFDRVAPEHVARVERWLKHRYGVVIVGSCAFFMVVPTDLVSYVAGTVQMPYLRFVCALMTGETILCAVYIFGGSWLTGALG